MLSLSLFFPTIQISQIFGRVHVNAKTKSGKGASANERTHTAGSEAGWVLAPEKVMVRNVYGAALKCPFFLKRIVLLLLLNQV